MFRATQAFCLFLPKEIATDLPVQVTTEGWRFLELSGLERCAHREGKLTRAQPEDHFIQFTTIHRGAHRSLLMNVAGQIQLTINGLPTACYRVVHPGDIICFESHSLQLSLRNRPYVGPPDETDFEATCGYCRTPIASRLGARVYVCPFCQLPTHFDDDEVEEERLNCFAMSAHCGHCQAEMMAREGFSHDPAL